jgi:GntR family transcriptional regulator
VLNKEHPVPLYYQLHTHLLQRIQSGELKPNDRLASEEELANLYGVSKITVRHALRELASAGYVRRQQGRGTFVAMPKLEQGPRELTSFSEEMRGHGYLASSRVLIQGIEAAAGNIAEKLHLAEGAPVFRLTRLRLADDEPMGVQTAFLPVDLAPGLAEENFETASLYEILRRKYGLAPARARETHYAVAADEHTAALLGIPTGSAALAAERITVLATGRPLELAESMMRGDRYRIVLDLVANEQGGR